MTIVGRSGAAALFVAAAILLLPALSPTVSSAHGHRHVGEFNFTVGFFVEPAFEGEKNGVDLRVERDGEPVLDVQQTLEVEVIHGDASVTLPLRAVWGQPGRYTADFFPTATGDFTFRFYGTIEGTAIDESFTSSTDNFSVVQPAADLQFPVRIASIREVQASVSGASEAASAADASASAATTRANLALALGGLGLLMGGGGLALSLRRRG